MIMKVIKCKFAAESDLKREDFKEALKDFCTENWSRVWEYPFAILNSTLEPGQKVLTAGCCGDELAYYFSRNGMDVTGVDVRACGGRCFKFVKADLRKLPFPNQSFDHVFCISVLEHLGTDPFDALVELVRVCKDKVIITVDYSRLRTPFRLDPWDFNSFCEKLGIEAPRVPKDVLKSEATEEGRRCGAGLSVCGFVIRSSP